MSRLPSAQRDELRGRIKKITVRDRHEDIDRFFDGYLDPHINGSQHQAQPITPLPFISVAEWEGKPVPPRRWLVPGRIPSAKVSLLTGNGAIGKTTVALQLAAATVRGTDWLGAVIDEPGPAMFISSEEDVDELHHRVDAIRAHFDVDCVSLAGLHLHSTVEHDDSSGVLAAVDRQGIVQPHPLFLRLQAAALDLHPKLIIIESAADLFAGEENKRPQVAQFVGMLKRLAIKADAAVLLLAHPSLTGMSTGTGLSGSTQWHNGPRARLYLDASDNEDDPELRLLKVMKSNYGPPGEIVKLRWQRGVFVPEGASSTHQRSAAEAKVDDAFLRCLDAAIAQGRDVSAKKSNAFAPAVFEGMPEANGAKRTGLAQAMERLFSTGKIKVETSGPPSKRRARLVRA
jgi:RecA-family ATPase